MQNRLLQFENIRNFRDFGGYETQCGGRLREQFLYRAAHQSDCSDMDIQKLNRLGIKVIIDLRRRQEQEKQPRNWPETAQSSVIELVECQLDEDGDAPHIAYLKQKNLSASSAEKFMQALYREIVLEPEHQRLFAHAITALATEKAPILIHCTAGKDRTGILCALILLLCGVARERVFEDYLLTHRANNLDQLLPQFLPQLKSFLGVEEIDEDALVPLFGVDPSFLEHAMEEIYEQYQSMEHYAHKALNIDSKLIAAMKDRLIIKA